MTMPGTTDHLLPPRHLNWPRACFAATLYVIALMLACQDTTRGGRLLGAAVLLGGTWTGALLAGVLVCGRDTH